MRLFARERGGFTDRRSTRRKRRDPFSSLALRIFGEGGGGGQIEIRVFLDNKVITFEFSEILSVAVQMKATEH